MSLFPIFLKLTGRPCIVIGGENLAESKIDSLRAAEARVTAIAPVAGARIAEMAEAGEIVWHRREYKQGDLAGQFLAVAATSDAAVSRAVFAEAEAAGILVNAVDDPPFCDFYFPSVVRRGELHVLRIRDFKPVRQIGLVYHKSESVPRILSELIRLFRKVQPRNAKGQRLIAS